ncbi:hypothetical protein SS50377_25491 [Spironucleus salmonicida]|nr:hypothetical protein SS50377_25491 [Spironucleus salmonicida]
MSDSVDDNTVNLFSNKNSKKDDQTYIEFENKGNRLSPHKIPETLFDLINDDSETVIPTEAKQTKFCLMEYNEEVHGSYCGEENNVVENAYQGLYDQNTIIMTIRTKFLQTMIDIDENIKTVNDKLDDFDESSAEQVQIEDNIDSNMNIGDARVMIKNQLKNNLIIESLKLQNINVNMILQSINLLELQEILVLYNILKTQNNDSYNLLKKLLNNLQ